MKPRTTAVAVAVKAGSGIAPAMASCISTIRVDITPTAWTIMAPLSLLVAKYERRDKFPSNPVSCPCSRKQYILTKLVKKARNP